MNRGQAPSETQGRTEDEARRWIRELQAGMAAEDNSRALFERYHGWVRGFFGRRGFSDREAEDLAQETFLQVFREIATFRGESSFEGWLFAVAANIWRNELRRREAGKRAARIVSLEPEEQEESPGPAAAIRSREASPERAAYEKERRAALRRAIDAMPPQMRQCLILRLDREMKYREIAKLMKMNLETVKAHLFQARRRLKDTLGAELGEWNE